MSLIIPILSRPSISIFILFLKLSAFTHHAQGKWYPGEPLPRWQTTIYWRKDGKAVWKNPDLLANMNTNYSYTTADAKTFISTLALILGVSDENE